jgi:2,4-didehydro-3-deoxy-L-rhamnonate hydrolase
MTALSDEAFHLGTFRLQRRPVTGIVLDGEVIELATAVRAARIPLPAFRTLRDLLTDWERNFAQLQLISAFLRRQGTQGLQPAKLEESHPLAPLGAGGKLLYAAANYSDHVAGMRKTFTPAATIDSAKPLPPLRPYMFGKMCVPTGAFDDIVLPRGIERTDWEAELMVVIGKPGRHIRACEVASHIAGYLTTNDVSCRDLTWREDRPTIRSDWLAGKSFDTFAPIGPYLTPKAFVPDHTNLSIRLWVNGVVKQEGNTRDMIFGVEDQVEYASRMMTLLPGDCIATGTPAGTGQERLEFLKSGDLVETEVEGCGRQRNRVVAEAVDPLIAINPRSAGH